MNKEQSEKYIDIVKNGNYDDMFDYGKEVTLTGVKIKRYMDVIMVSRICSGYANRVMRM